MKEPFSSVSGDEHKQRILNEFNDYTSTIAISRALDRTNESVSDQAVIVITLMTSTRVSENSEQIKPGVTNENQNEEEVIWHFK